MGEERGQTSRGYHPLAIQTDTNALLKHLSPLPLPPPPHERRLCARARPGVDPAFGFAHTFSPLDGRVSNTVDYCVLLCWVYIVFAIYINVSFSCLFFILSFSSFCFLYSLLSHSSHFGLVLPCLFIFLLSRFCFSRYHEGICKRISHDISRLLFTLLNLLFTFLFFLFFLNFISQTHFETSRQCIFYFHSNIFFFLFLFLLFCISFSLCKFFYIGTSCLIAFSDLRGCLMRTKGCKYLNI